MGIEHSKGSQTLCYINAQHEEECFRNEFQMENIFEMGFDIVQKDNLDATLKYGLEHLEDLDHDQRQKIAAFTQALTDQKHHPEIVTEAHHHQAPLPDHHHQAPLEHHSPHHHLEPQHQLHHHQQHPQTHKPLDQHSEELQAAARALFAQYSAGGDQSVQLHEAGQMRQAASQMLDPLGVPLDGHFRSEEEIRADIESDFASKLLEFKSKESGEQHKIFGHTMVSYGQLAVNVTPTQCVQIEATSIYHTRRKEKWLCHSDLDMFWETGCIDFENELSICDEDAIALFVGRCAEQNGFEVCPGDPVIIESVEEEQRVPAGCHKDKFGAILCPDHLYSAFKYGSCLKVGETFICEEDMPAIIENQCVKIEQKTVCGQKMYELFTGETVYVDGHPFELNLPTKQHSFDDLCRPLKGQERVCQEEIEDIYQPPHDCVMISAHWYCMDVMFKAWKNGCIDIGEHTLCGDKMVETVMQDCVEIDNEWVCPSAVGTKHGGYPEFA